MFKFEEKILLNQIRRGQQAAFSKLYDYYQDKIYRFIYFRVSDEGLAQDLTSETFMKALRYLVEGETVNNLRGFLYRIAKNLVIDFYRQRGQTELPIDDFIEDNLPAEKNLLQDVEERFNLEQIKDSLNKLSAPYREVIVLRFVEDLPFKEIANILEIKEDNARMLAHRGLKILRKQIEINRNK